MTLTELFEIIKEHLGDKFQPQFERICEQFGCWPIAAKENLRDKLFELGFYLNSAEAIVLGLEEEFVYHSDTGWTLSVFLDPDELLDELKTDLEMEGETREIDEDEIRNEIEKLIEQYQIEAMREISARLKRRLMDLGWVH